MFALKFSRHWHRLKPSKCHAKLDLSWKLKASYITSTCGCNHSGIGHFAPRRNYSDTVTKQHKGLVHKEPWQWSLPDGHDTGIRVQNSYHCLRSNKEIQHVPFIVEDPNYVRWYACGPTVYDRSHIGHASTYLQFDLIRRILTNFFGLKICMVMGVTNMDNKIINRALLYDNGIMEVADKFELEFKEVMAALNVLPPTTYIRVTDIIPQIIGFIQKLIDKGQAYVTEKGNVYFSYNDAPQSIAKLCAEFYEPDISAAGEKKFVKDISLWKTPQPGEPYWDAPWGMGRPGWHIECSVMASMCFGEKVDIHSGAIDLRFPHHEYEIAQCDAYHKCHQWVNYFLHSGHMAYDGKKMSKSIGNIVTIRECLQEYEQDFLRMVCCRVTWHKNYKYNQDLVDRSLQGMTTIREFFQLCDKIMSGKVTVNVDHTAVNKAIQTCDEAVQRKLRDNFNITGTINDILRLVAAARPRILEDTTVSGDISSIVKAANYVEVFLDNLGFTFHHRSPEGER